MSTMRRPARRNSCSRSAVRREQGAVARQREPERLGQAVHRVRGEHPRARAAGRAGGALDLVDLRLLALGVGGGHHRVDEIELDDAVAAGMTVLVVGCRHLHLARLHRSARDEHDRDVQPHRRVQHPRGDLVAVGDADEGVGAVRVDHVLDGVGDELAGRQAVEHAAVTHRDAVVDGDRVELLGDAARGLDLARDELPEILQVHVPRHELGERVRDRDDRLVEVAVLHARGAPQRAGTGHVAAVGRGSRAVLGHGALRGCGFGGDPLVYGAAAGLRQRPHDHPGPGGGRKCVGAGRRCR